MAESGGQPNNTNSTADKRLVTSALRRAVAQNPEKLRNACLKVLDDAEQGNLPAFNVIADRLDGKAIQALEMSGPDGEKLELIKIIHE